VYYYYFYPRLQEMEGQAPKEGGEQRGGRGGRGFGRGGRGGAGGARGGPRGDKDEWIPKTKLGRLVKYGHIGSLEEIYTHSIPIKEAPIVDKLMKDAKKSLMDEVMKIISVQKQTKAGQRTRFKAVVVIGDADGHVGLGIKVAKEVQIAIKGALIVAKLNLLPVRRGYWGNKIGKVHTVAQKTTGKGGSVRVKLVPAPRGTGIVAAPLTKKILQFAGIDDVYTSSTGHTRTGENFVKACFDSLANTYHYLSPDLWTKTENLQSPLTKHAEWLE
jgi:small subunit ribosomal protein S2e